MDDNNEFKNEPKESLDYIFSFPIKYGFEDKDTFVKTFTVQDAIEVTNTKTKLDKVDAYGILIFGKDTIKNVLRTVSYTNSHSVVKAIHPNAKNGFYTYESYRYRWWSLDKKDIVLMIDDDYYIDNFGEEKSHKEISYSRFINSYLSNKEIFPLELNVYVDNQKSINILFNLTQQTTVNITLTDISGRTISNIKTNENMNAGNHNIKHNADLLASGIYIITINTIYGKESMRFFL